MGAATTLVLGVRLEMVPEVMVKVMNVEIKTFCQKWTGTNAPVRPMASSVLTMPFLKNKAIDKI